MVEVINAASKNVTTVMVAHKLQTVVDADLILVMQDGLLVEQGTHTSLLCQANSTYARMWAEQAGGFGGAARADGEDLDYCTVVDWRSTTSLTSLGRQHRQHGQNCP